MKKMKLKALVLALLLILLGTVSAGTLAYFTADETAHNVITSGGVAIELVEQIDEAGTLWPEKGVTGVMPGENVTKIVTVKNTGASDAWIRVLLTKAVLTEAGDSLDSGKITYEINPGWVRNEADPKDEYYYYTEKVSPGKSTGPIIKAVRFDAEMGNEYQNCTVSVDVSAQAVQVANNGADVLEAKGWPAE